MSLYSQPQYAAPNLPGGIPNTQTSTMAIFSLVLGIASFLCSLLAGIPAIILGIIALSKIGKSNGRLQGSGLATAGIVTGAIGCLLSVVMLGVLLPAVQAVRGAARRTVTMNNMRQICLGSLNYESSYMRFPSNFSDRDPDAGEMLSWRVHVLPFCGDEASRLYDQFHLDEPWDSAHNKTLIPLMPMFYEHPQLPDLPEGHTVYQMPTSGPDDEFRAIHVDGERGTGIRKHQQTALRTRSSWSKPTPNRQCHGPSQSTGDLTPTTQSKTLAMPFPAGPLLLCAMAQRIFLTPKACRTRTLAR